MKEKPSFEFLLTLGLVMVVAFYIFAPSGYNKEDAKKTACLSDLRQCAIATIIYAEDTDGRLPNGDTWMDQLTATTLKNDYALACPNSGQIAWKRGPFGEKIESAGYGRAMNRFLSEASLAKLDAPEKMHLYYDSAKLGRNVSEYFPSFPSPARIHAARTALCIPTGMQKASLSGDPPRKRPSCPCRPPSQRPEPSSPGRLSERDCCPRQAKAPHTPRTAHAATHTCAVA